MRRTLCSIGVTGCVIAALALGSTLPATAGTAPDGTRVTGERLAAQPATQPAAQPATKPATESGPETLDSEQEIAQRGDFTGTGIRIRANPRLNATVLGHGNRGDGLTIVGSGHGDTVNCPGVGNTADWMKVRNSRTGVTGWVSICYVRIG